MKKIVIFLILFFLGISQVMAKGPKSKFYDFSDQLIDGQVKNPLLYTQMLDKESGLSGY